MKIKHLSFVSFLLIVIFSLISQGSVYGQSDELNSQTVVHLLGYVALDYPEAVQDGEVIDEEEYLEQVEFSEYAYKLTEEGTFLTGEEKDRILSWIQELRDYIDEKRSEEEIRVLADRIVSEIMEITGILTSPQLWPSLASGRALYEVTCATCHGDTGKGDGIAGLNLDPPPSNFHDGDLMNNFSAYQAYNSIKLGIPGTGMIAYTQYSEEELWDLAFYVHSLQFEESIGDDMDLRQTFTEAASYIDLPMLANYSNREILDSLKKVTDNAEEKLRALRLHVPDAEEPYSSLVIAEDELKAALQSYKEENYSLARTQAINAYLEGIEPVESQLRALDAPFVSRIEEQMYAVRNAIENEKEIEVVQEEIEKALDLIAQADQILEGDKPNYWLTFFLAGMIFLREGLEAFLLIMVILALIHRTGARRALPWLHGGWITAVILGVVGWYMSDYVIQFGGKNREIMEGLVSLLAVVVLLYVGFWLHSRSETNQWAAFVKNKIGRYLERDKMFGLAAFAFIVVFREAFEVILFLQAVSLEATSANQSAIGLGVLAAGVCIALIAYAFIKYSKMVSIRRLFLYSSWIIVVLAVILMGKGLHSLQESGWLSVTLIKSMFRIEWLGIYPTVQTIMGQISLIVLIVLLYLLNKRRNKKMKLIENETRGA